MANKNFSRFERVSDRVRKELDRDANDARRSQTPSHLFSTDNALRGLAASKRKEVVLLQVPPARVKMWREHNRRYDLLDEKRCADLIESFRRTGKQEFPAIVRRVSADSEYDYELICGARRHWTASHLGWDLMIEIRDLDDRQAFTLQDLENRDREDISDYERATDYKNALMKYFDGNRAAMSKFLEVDRGNLSRLLDLAELPAALVAVYSDLRELKVHHGVVFKKIIADPKLKRRLLERAKQLAKHNLPGKKILSELKKIDLVPDSPRQPQEARIIEVEGVARPIRVTTSAEELIIKLPRVSGRSREQVMQALAKFLDTLEP